VPTWHAPEQSGDPNLDRLINELTQEIASGPSFEAVTGIDSGEMAETAFNAIAAFFKSHDVDPGDPQSWAQVFILGFILGLKYGEQRTADSSHHMKGNTR